MYICVVEDVVYFSYCVFCTPFIHICVESVGYFYRGRNTRQLYRQTNPTDRQAPRYKDLQTDRHIDRQIDKKSDRQTDRHRLTDIETGRQTDRKTYTYKIGQTD